MNPAKYRVIATIGSGATTSSASVSYLVSGTLRDSKVTDNGAPLGFTAPEFPGIPSDRAVTLNLDANKAVELCVGYVSGSGRYTALTPAATR